MPPGKVHPYLVSFMKVGFVARDPASGLYELGHLALELGLAKLHRLDPVREASQAIADLAAETGHGTGLVVWGNLGPTLIRLEEPAHPLHVNLRIGTVMSLVHTATGRLFAAYLPAKVVSRVLEADPMGVHFGSRHQSRPAQEDYERQLSEIRSRGISRTPGQPHPGHRRLLRACLRFHGAHRRRPAGDGPVGDIRQRLGWTDRHPAACLRQRYLAQAGLYRNAGQPEGGALRKGKVSGCLSPCGDRHPGRGGYMRSMFSWMITSPHLRISSR